MPVSFKAQTYNYLGRNGRMKVGHACTIGLAPWGGVIGAGETPEDALHIAASLAANLQAQLAKHPALAALLPPGVGLAFQGLAVASKALKEGKEVAEVATDVGKHVANLASKVLSLF